MARNQAENSRKKPLDELGAMALSHDLGAVVFQIFELWETHLPESTKKPAKQLLNINLE